MQKNYNYFSMNKSLYAYVVWLLAVGAVSNIILNPLLIRFDASGETIIIFTYLSFIGIYLLIFSNWVTILPKINKDKNYKARMYYTVFVVATLIISALI